MKKILLSGLIIVSVFALTGCFNINLGGFIGEGVLRVENNSSSDTPIKAFVMYQEQDGDLKEAYRNDGVYAESGESPVSVNIKSGGYADYNVAVGHYDIWFFSIADGYWYYCIKEDVYVSSGGTTVSIESGEWSLLVPSKASSMRNVLPEVVKNQVFATEL